MIERNASLLTQAILENMMGDMISRKKPHLALSAINFKKKYLIIKHNTV
jgi:hypothetical protein